MVKRAFDLIAAVLGLLVLSPLLVVIALLVRLDTPGPVFFLQERVGRRGRAFRIFKFRTMHVSAGAGRQLTVGRDPRVTRVGWFLRKWKLDEIPQLLNVVKGDMSLVGPRPEVPRYVAFYNAEQRQVLEVRPGITDLASVEFRDENELLDAVDDPERFYLNRILPRKLELNARYVKERSLWLDLRIIALTVFRVLRPAGEVPASLRPNADTAPPARR